MPTLEWIGKDKVVNHHQQVPYRMLEEKYTYNAEKSDNMIIRGDNLEALKALLPKYEGKIKMVLTVRAEAIKTDSGYSVNGYELLIGNDMTIRTPSFTGTGICTSITLSEETR